MDASQIQPVSLIGFRDDPSSSNSEDDKLFDQFLSAPKDDPDDAQFDGFLHNAAPQMARQRLDEYKEGKLDLTPEQVKEHSKIAQDGVGAWESLGHSIRYIFGLDGPPEDETSPFGPGIPKMGNVRLIGKMIAEGAKGVHEAGKEMTGPEVQLASDLEAGHPIDALWNYGRNKYQLAKEIGQGSARGLAGFAPVLGGATAEATELAAEPFISKATAQDLNAKLNAGTYEAEHLKNKAFNYIAKATGVDPNKPAYAASEQVAPLAVPLGGAEKGAETVEKLGDVILDKGVRVLGQTAKATGRAGQVAAPTVEAGAGAALLAHGHFIEGPGLMAPLAAQITGHEITRHGYGIGRFITAISEAPWNYLYEQGKFLASVPEGETVLGWARTGMQNDLDHLGQQLEDIKATNGSKVDNAFKTAADGSPLHPTQDLKGEELKARQIQERMIDLQRRIGVIKGYENINRATSAAVRTGLKIGIDSTLAGTIGAGYAGSTESPGEYEQARQGFAAGAAIGLAGRIPKVPMMIRGELRDFNRRDLINAGAASLKPTDPYYQQHRSVMTSIPQTARDYVNVYSGLADANGKKVVVLPDADFAKEVGTEAQRAPDGFYDEQKGTAFIKGSSLRRGTLNHEVGHALAEAGGLLDENHPVRQAIDEAFKDPKIAEAIKKNIPRYNRAMRNSDPLFPGLSEENVKSEMVADVIGDILHQGGGPEAFYGGRSLAQRAGQFIRSFLPQKPTVTTHGWTIPTALRDAVSDSLFKAGQHAEELLRGEAKGASTAAPPLSDEDAAATKDATDIINALNKNKTAKARADVEAQVKQAANEMRIRGDPVDAQSLIAATQTRTTRNIPVRSGEFGLPGYTAINKSAAPPPESLKGFEQYRALRPDEKLAAVYNALSDADWNSLQRAQESGLIKTQNDFNRWIALHSQPKQNLKPGRSYLPGFYSQLEKTVEDKMPNKADPKQVLGIIRGGGVKKAELEWNSPLNDFLEHAQSKNIPVTKGQVLDAIRAGTPEVNEVYRSSEYKEPAPEFDEGDIETYPRNVQREAERLRASDMEGWKQSAEQNFFDDFSPELDQRDFDIETIPISKEEENLKRGAGETDLFGKTIPTLPDEEHYKLLVDGDHVLFDDLPKDHKKWATEDEDGVAIFDDEDQAREAYYEMVQPFEDDIREEAFRDHMQTWERDWESEHPLEDYASQAADNAGFEIPDEDAGKPTNKEALIGRPRHSSWKLPGGENYREFELALDPNSFPRGRDTFVNPGHYPERDLVAHFRTTDRTTTDGRPMLFAEEGQSDWAQTGAKKGFAKTPEEIAKITKKRDDLIYDRDNLLMRAGYKTPDGKPDFKRFGEDRDKIPKAMAISDEYNRLNREANDYALSLHSGVPNMPFKGEGWQRLVMRNLIKKAIDEGKQSVGWTTGAQQVERYKSNLREAVDTIQWSEPQSDGSRVVEALKNGESRFRGQVDKNGKFTDSVAKNRLMEDVLGKTMADQIMASNKADQIAGDQITIGGFNLVQLYDHNLVNIANDLVKKFGSKVQRTGLTDLSYDNYARFDTHAQADQFIRNTPTNAIQDSWQRKPWTAEEGFKNVSGIDRPGDKKSTGWWVKDADGNHVTFRTHPEVWELPITDALKREVQQKGQPMFLPQSGEELKPWKEKIEGPAIRVAGFQFTGETYAEAEQKAKQFGFEQNDIAQGEKGFYTKKGRFLTPDQAGEFASQAKQMGKVQGERPLRTQAFNRFRKYEPGVPATGSMEFFSPDTSETKKTFEDVAGSFGVGIQPSIELSQEIDQNLGLQGENSPAIGRWEGGAEPSVVHRIETPTTPEELKYIAAIKGKALRQKAVLTWQPDENGQQSMHTLELNGTPTEVSDRLLAAGLPDQTIEPLGNGRTRVSIYDPANELGDKIEKFLEPQPEEATVGRESNQPSEQGNTVRGSGEFVGEPAGSRTKAQIAYNKIISEYEANPKATRRYQGKLGSINDYHRRLPLSDFAELNPPEKYTKTSFSAPSTAPEAARDQIESLVNRYTAINNSVLPLLSNPGSPELRIKEDQMRKVADQIDRLKPIANEPVAHPEKGVRHVVVVGAGPAGMMAAIHSRIEGLDTMIIDGSKNPGGQFRRSTRLENVGGYPVGVSGPQLASDIWRQVSRWGAAAKLGTRAEKLEIDPSGTKTLHLSNGEKVRADAVVIAGGVSFRPLEFPGSDLKGVFQADADALARYARGRSAVVVGGSNGASQAALGVSENAKQVHLIARSPLEKSMSDYQRKALGTEERKGKMEVIIGDEIAKANGDKFGRIESVDTKSGKHIDARGGLTYFIGASPDSSWIPDNFSKDKDGRLKVNLENYQVQDSEGNDIPGVYAVGDIRSGTTNRVETAKGEGAAAAARAVQYIKTKYEKK